jgi:hypothetical protein
MRRALITSLGLVAGAAGAVPVLAAPANPVDAGRTAGISATTKLANGDTLTLAFSAAQLSGGPRLLVDTVRCDEDGNCTSQLYAADLPAGALTIAASDPIADLRSDLDGQALAISWRPQTNGGYTVGSGTIGGDDAGLYGTEYAGTSADTTIDYAGHTCGGTGGVGDGAVVDSGAASGGSEAKPLSALHLPDGAVLRC